jgi:hypothetical protein
MLKNTKRYAADLVAKSKLNKKHSQLKDRPGRVSSSHSCQITIKNLMIMLSFHGQNTGALLLLKASGQAIFQKLTRQDVFVKQADKKMFA